MRASRDPCCTTSCAGEAGPLVVLTHGLGGRLEFFAPHVEALARRHRVLRWDLRGAGRSEKPPVRIPQRSSPAISPGCSTTSVSPPRGSSATREAAWSRNGSPSIYPSRALGLVLASTSSEVGEKATAAWNRLADTVERQGFGSADREPDPRGFGPDFAAAHPEVVRALARADARQRPARVRRERARLRRIQLDGGARSAPRSDPHPPGPGRPDDTARGLGDPLTALPRARLVMVPGAGHNLPIEMPELFTTAILAFLGGWSSRPLPRRFRPIARDEPSTSSASTQLTRSTPAAMRLAMKSWYALSAIGRDRPGIVADLAELIYECDCNLEDSSMTILGSEFAVLLLLSSGERGRRAASLVRVQATRVGEAPDRLLPTARRRAGLVRDPCPRAPLRIAGDRRRSRRHRRQGRALPRRPCGHDRRHDDPVATRARERDADLHDADGSRRAGAGRRRGARATARRRSAKSFRSTSPSAPTPTDARRRYGSPASPPVSASARSSVYPPTCAPSMKICGTVRLPPAFCDHLVRAARRRC